MIIIKIKNITLRIFNIDIEPIVVILYYHSVYPEYIDKFDRQIELLKKNTKIINFGNEFSLEPNQNYCAITFDDGFKNVKENALPVLKKYNIPATVFCLASNFGENPIWEYDPVTQDKFEKIMTIEEIKSLPTDIISIGSHTLSHAKLTKISDQKIKSELLDSKKILEAELSRDVDLFSFPNGEYNKEIIEAAFNCGYKKLFTIEPKLASHNDAENIMGRFSVEPWDWPIEFRLKILGYYRWLMLAQKIKRSLR